MNDAEVGFTIGEHPYYKYRIEDVRDLELVYSTDILQGAFIGDIILRLPGGDFSSKDGWRGLVEWCLRLHVAVQRIRGGATEFEITEPDTDILIVVSRRGDMLHFRRVPPEDLPEILPGPEADIEADRFVDMCSKFVRERVRWIAAEYPAALRNVDARDIWDRLKEYIPSME